MVKRKRKERALRLTEAARAREMERQLNIGLVPFSSERKCLLDIDPSNLFQRSTEQQQYWLNVIYAAIATGEGRLPQRMEK